MKYLIRRATALGLVFGLLAVSLTIADESKDKTEAAPDKYKVKFETTCGDFVVEVHREWAPVGADRFHDLVSKGFYDECGFFRVVPGFMVQFGINGEPTTQQKWREATIKDDKVIKSNTRGFITFATSGPNSRTSQVFINYGDNSRLDDMGFAPFGEVVEGMDVVDRINPQYRERPQQGEIQTHGNAYLKEKFPKLDFIKTATIVEPKNSESLDKAK
jgi:peptidyl-prolyl cis-trans isomerase A (cyclophilin A)